MSHKLIPIGSLQFQDGYNIVRSDKELTANSKEVEKAMEAQNDDPTLFPIKYVTVGNKKFTRNHATLRAALARGWKEVYAMPSPHEANSLADMLDLVFSNNQGHPVSRVAQGKLYAKLRDGELDEEATAKAAKDAKVGEEVAQVWKREPMSLEEIGAALKPSYTGEHVRQCILLAESSPEIGELLESGEVSSGVVISAKSLAKDDEGKALKIIKAAVRKAKDDGKECATKQHFDAVKADFTPQKKLVAAGKETKEEPAVEQKGTQEAAQDEKAPEPPATLPTDDSEPALFTKDAAQSPVKAKDAKKALVTVLLKWAEDSGNTFTDDEVDELADRIIDANLPL